VEVTRLVRRRVEEETRPVGQYFGVSQMKTRQPYSGNYMADLVDAERERECEECGGVDEHLDDCSRSGRDDFALREFHTDMEVDRRIEARMERDMEEEKA
jgi:hypothetical protein